MTHTIDTDKDLYSRHKYTDPAIMDEILYHAADYGEPETHLDDFDTNVDKPSVYSASYGWTITPRHLAALNLLPPHLRRVLELRFTDHLTENEIAKKIGRTQGAVSHEITTARQLITKFKNLPDLYYDKPKLKVALEKAGLKTIEVNFFMEYVTSHHVYNSSMLCKISQPQGSMLLKRIKWKLQTAKNGDLLLIYKIMRHVSGFFYPAPVEGRSTYRKGIKINTVYAKVYCQE